MYVYIYMYLDILKYIYTFKQVERELENMSNLSFKGGLIVNKKAEENDSSSRYLYKVLILIRIVNFLEKNAILIRPFGFFVMHII
jgi:hypothetical protein